MKVPTEYAKKDTNKKKPPMKHRVRVMCNNQMRAAKSIEFLVVVSVLESIESNLIVN